MLSAIRHSSLLLVASLLLLGLSACAPQQFSAVQPASPSANAAPPAAQPTPRSCTTQNIESIRRLTKILFVVDTSGSNATFTINNGTNGFGGYSVPPTDPQKTFRGGALNDFFTRYNHKSNFQWGFVTFSADSARALINFGNIQTPAFAADLSQMRLALNAFYGQIDDGNTPYRSALQMAARTIQLDPDLKNASSANYMVIMITDGFPTDYHDMAGLFQQAALDRDIATLLAAAPGQVNLSTIYYGLENDPNAIALLSRMAAQGGGQFASVNDPNSGFKIDDVIPGASSGCP